MHEAGAAIVAAASSARAGDASAASQQGMKAERLLDASVAVLDSVPVAPGEETFRQRVRLVASNIQQASFSFVGFVPGEIPSIDDMVADTPAALAIVQDSLKRLDGEVTAPIASSDLCRAVVVPTQS